MRTEYMQNLDIQAIKDMTRLAWLLNFEALATADRREPAFFTDVARLKRARPKLRTPLA